jgi:hypothetical protein
MKANKMSSLFGVKVVPSNCIKIKSREFLFRKYLLYTAIIFLTLKAVTGGIFFLLSGSFFGCVLLLIGVLKKESTTLPFIVVVFIFLISYILTYLNNYFSNGSLFLFLMFGSIGIAWEMCKNCLSVTFASFIFYISSFVYLFLYFIFDFSAGSILDHSRNHVSVYFINLTALLFIALNSQKVKDYKRYITPTIITVFISVLAIGISGIISSMLLFALVFLHALKGKVTSSLFLVLTPMLLFFLYPLELTNIFSFNSELLGKLDPGKLTSEDARYEIWGEYISSLDWIRILTGVPLSETFNGHQNLHSSYFLLHSRIGFFLFFLIVIAFISLLRMFKLSKLLFFCLLSILVRGYSDTTFLSASSFDFVLFYFLLFYPYRAKYVAFK